MTCTTQTKTYPTCQIPKPLTDFWKSLKSKHGVQAHCKLCQAIRKRGGLPSVPRKPKTIKLPKPHEPAPNGSVDAINVEPKYSKPDRYSIVRNTHRRTGQCSWGIFDSTPYDHSNPVIFVGENLKDTLVECERLNAPVAKIRYTKRGRLDL